MECATADLDLLSASSCSTGLLAMNLVRVPTGPAESRLSRTNHLPPDEE